MKRFLVTLVIGALAVFATQWQTRGAALQSPDGSPSHRFEEIADDVYFAIGTGSMTVMSNSLVIINDDHVMLVDSSVTPAAARGLVEGIKTLTNKPIKYVFNSHYHFDHAHGNQIFGDDVEIIGHEFVREMLLSDVLNQRTNRSFTEGIPTQIEQMKARVAQTTGAAEREQLKTQLHIQEAHWQALQETRPTPPNVTYRDAMTLVKGGREVQLHFLGRGHTGGASVTRYWLLTSLCLRVMSWPSSGSMVTNAWDPLYRPAPPVYCSSATGSIHSMASGSPAALGKVTETCVSACPGAAPCQCRTPRGRYAVSCRPTSLTGRPST